MIFWLINSFSAKFAFWHRVLWKGRYFPPWNYQPRKKRIFKIRRSEQKLFNFKVWLKTVFFCQKVTVFSPHSPKKLCLGGRRGACPPRLHKKIALFEHLKDTKSNIRTLGKVQARIIPNGIVYALYQHFHKTFVNILPQKYPN